MIGKRRYMQFQRGGGNKYIKFQRGGGLSTLMINPGINPRRCRRRRYQKGRGFGSFIRSVGRIGKAVAKNPMVQKFAKEMIIPTAWNVVKKKLGEGRRF